MIRIPPLPSPPLRDAVLPAGSRAGQSRTGFSGSARPGSPFKAAPEVQQPELQLQQVGVPRGLRPTARALSGATQRPRPDAAPRSPAAPGGGGGGSGSGRPVAAWLLRGRLLAKAQPGNGEGAAESPASSRQRAVPGHRGRGEPCPKGRDIWGGGEGFATLLGGLGLQLWEGGGLAPVSHLERCRGYSRAVPFWGRTIWGRSI